MRTDEFSRGMRDLSEYFGEKHYPDVKKNRIWKIVHRIPYADFRGAIDRLCEEQRFAPTPGEIRQACAPFIRRAKESWVRDQLTKIAKCEWCDNCGVRFAVKNGQECLQYQFRCSCLAAQILALSGIPLWDEAKYGREFTCVKFDTGEMREEARLAARAMGVPERDVEPRSEWMKLGQSFLKAKGVKSD